MITDLLKPSKLMCPDPCCCDLGRNISDVLSPVLST